MYEDNKIDFGKNLRRIRKLKELTQEDLAKMIGVRRETVSRYETGLINPPLSLLAKIAKALNVTSAELFGNDAQYKAYYDDAVERVIKKTKMQLDENGQISIKIDDMQEIDLLAAFRELNGTGKTVAVERVEELAKIPEYKKAQTPAADSDET